MAFEMEYTDQYGDTYAESYWRVAETNMNQADKLGRIIFYGFASADKKGGRIIGQKSYDINQAGYQAFFAPSELNPADKNPAIAAYEYAKDVKDVVVDGEEVSFFANAVNV